MPRNKVLERAKVSVGSGRSAFDVSQVRNFTSLLGEIGIAYCRPFVAGTTGKIGRKTFTRTAQVVAPAFHRVTEHFDFFVVPIHSLWRGWENWKLNINDMQDTNLVPWDSSNIQPDLALPANAPRVDFTSLVERMGLAYDAGPAPAGMIRKANDVLRFCDELRYSTEAAVGTFAYPARVQNLFKIAAYQKCYFDHYRNTAYESNNPYAYNLDWLFQSQNGLLNPVGSHTVLAANGKDAVVARELFTRRRVNYRNDYYHNIYPSLNYVVSKPQGTNFSIPSDIGQITGGGLTVDPNNGSVYPSNNFVPTGSSFSTNRSMTVQNIRAAFALDRLMRASAYAPKHVRDQYKAQYGVDGVEDFDMKSERIGSFQSDVILQEVTNMAQSTAGMLGDLGAKGLGASEDDNMINFYCKYDSVVIGLHYFSLRAVYDNFGIDQWNTYITRDSFFIKAFEKLGLRPLYDFNIKDAPNSTGAVLGWTEANYVYKIEADLNIGEFKNGFSYFDVDSSGVIDRVTGLDRLCAFVPHAQAPLASTVTAEWFKVAPEDMDNVFAVAVPSHHPIGYYQFYGERRIKVAIVAPMSVHSQPI